MLLFSGGEHLLQLALLVANDVYYEHCATSTDTIRNVTRKHHENRIKCDTKRF